MDIVENIMGKKFECEHCKGEGGRVVKGSPHGAWEFCPECKGKGYR